LVTPLKPTDQAEDVPPMLGASQPVGKGVKFDGVGVGVGLAVGVGVGEGEGVGLAVGVGA